MFVKYTVHYYDEIDEGNSVDCGLVSAEDMNGIFENLKKYYGDIDELTVEFIDDADGTNVVTAEDARELFS